MIKPVLQDEEWLDEARADAERGYHFSPDSVRKLIGHIAALDSKLATLRASVVNALSSAGPEVGEDERAP